MTPTGIAERLGRTGLCICPNFLGVKALGSLRNDFDQIQESGGFHPAGVGRGADLQRAENIRRDEIYWLQRDENNLIQAALWQRLDILQQALNRTLYLGLRSFEGHYASYPPGGFYHRHRDSFRTNSDRMVSLVIYLNRNWQEAYGGRLRIYDKDSHLDVDPIGGTLVCFLSRETEHEVLESFAPRQSFTGWFKV